MADIQNLTVLPRPRSAWQAMDAGFTLARAHYFKLVVLWLGFALPVFLISALIQYQFGWSYMLIIWWWFKPMYELPITLYLSRALFSETLSMREAWKMSLSQLSRQFATYLSYARLSTARSMTAGVVFLEQLPRKKRSTRIRALTLEPTRHTVLLFACINIEIIIAYSLLTIVGGLFLSDAMTNIDFESLAVFASDSTGMRLWLIAMSLTTLVAASLVAPFYVAGGFLIYINRRMQLEAWDIEHRFRRIKPRNATIAASVLLMVFALGTSDPSVATERAPSLNSPAEVATEVQEILAREDFGATKTRRSLKFKDSDDKDEFDTDWLDWFKGGSSSSIAGSIKGILWLMIIAFAGLLIYTLLQFKPSRQRTKNTLSRSGRDGDDAQSHPLTQNLPTDIVSAAQHLLQSGDRRQALSVLFRGALRAVMNEYDLKVPRGATESDCKHSVSSVANDSQNKTFSNLLNVWQKEAYANQPQQEQTIASLIEDWKQAFTGATERKDTTMGDAT